MLDPNKSAPAIQTDPKVLLKEIEEILNPEANIEANIGSVKYYWGKHTGSVYEVKGGLPESKCICPIKLKTKKKKNRGLPPRKQANGYSDFCPVHKPY